MGLHMVELIPSATHVVAGRITGKVTKTDVQLLTRELDARLADHPRVGFYVEVDRFRGIEPGALLEDLRYGLAHYEDLGRMHAALVAEPGWLRRMADLENRLFKKAEIRTFSRPERHEALAWVTEASREGHVEA